MLSLVGAAGPGTTHPPRPHLSSAGHHQRDGHVPHARHHDRGHPLLLSHLGTQEAAAAHQPVLRVCDGVGSGDVPDVRDGGDRIPRDPALGEPPPEHAVWSADAPALPQHQVCTSFV